jgi:hypothetical protein
MQCANPASDVQNAARCNLPRADPFEQQFLHFFELSFPEFSGIPLRKF